MSWKNFLRRRRADSDLLEEIESYFREEIAENKARGMSEEEATRQARIKFGSCTAVRETEWRQNGIPFMDSLSRDLRFAVRTLLRTPGFSLIAIGVMALCIGATTSLFTVVRSVLLRPLPFRNPDRLVMLYEHFRDPGMNAQQFNYSAVSPADFYDWRTQTHGFDDIAAWRWWQFNLTGDRGQLPELVNAAGGSWNLFPLLGVQAAIGRTFTQSEDRTDSYVAMLGWSLYQRRFGGDPAIVGKQIHLDGKLYTVVGILPKWFNYPDAKMQIWVPYQSGMPPAILQHHDFHFTRVVARLKPDVSLASALSQVEAVQYQMHMRNLSSSVAEDVASKTLLQDLAQNVNKPLVILLCAVVCLLLIGCLNVANLMVARSTTRQKEIALRSAMGAQRASLIRGQLMESVLISIVGGIAGVLLSLAASHWLARTWKDLPSAQSIHIDGVVLVFSCATIFAAALLAGLIPAIFSTGKGAIRALQASSRSGTGSRRRTALRKAMLVVEIATTVVLLIGAGLLLKSFWRLRTTDLGCASDHVLTLSYSLPQQKYDSPEKVNAFNEALLDRLRAMPGVQSVALGSMVPGAGAGEGDDFTIVEQPPLGHGKAAPTALYRSVSPGYFGALQIPLLRGRFFTKDDRTGHPRVIVVSRQLAEQYFPGDNPLGKHIHIAAHGNADFEIVGVVGDTVHQVGQPEKSTMYVPILSGENNGGITLAVRTASDPTAMSLPIQKQIAQVDPDLPVSDVLTMRQIIERSLGNARLSASLVLAFAVLSLLLASVGLYGVQSYLTTQRTGEIGLRMALGAQRRDVLGLMLGDGLRPAFYGLIVGLGLAAGAVRFVQSVLYRTQPLDPIIFASVAGSLVAVAAMACIVPAWRASRMDPMKALRTE